MSNKFHHNLRGDDILKYLSLLSTIDSNSKFCYRLNVVLTEAYAMWRSGKFSKGVIDKVLENGNPQMEDPQEILFVETVNTHYGSFRVFSTYFLTHKDLLSQLLFLAAYYKVEKLELGIVYALLELSDIIAQRSGCARYVVGDWNRESIFLPNYKEFGKNKNRTVFTKDELDEVLAHYELSIIDINALLLDVRKDVLKKELDNTGYSDLFELHPLLKLHDGSYLVLFPFSLLRVAYCLCYDLLKKKLGEVLLLEYIEKGMINQVGMILQHSLAQYLEQNVYANVPFLWFQFDEDKVANVAIVLVDKMPNLSDALVTANKELQKEYPDRIIFELVIYQQMNERGGTLTFDKPITHLNIEELEMVLSRNRMNLLNLYYYDQDKSKLTFPLKGQEIDIFAYYHSKECSFYMDDKPHMLFVEIGTALELREDFLSTLDKHVVKYAPQQSRVLVKHFADLPKQMPIYVPYMQEKNLLMLQLSENELWLHFGEVGQYKPIFKEMVISIFCWIYALERKKSKPICKDTHVELVLTSNGEICWNEVNDYLLFFCIPKTIFEEDPTTLELKIIRAFHSALRKCGFALDVDLTEVIEDMFNENPGRFLQIADPKSTSFIDVKDGVTSCYFVNKRYCDVILSEIADFLNIKGKERKFNNKESKEILIKVSDYLKDEVGKILQSFDSEMMLKAFLDLHHAMTYWSRLTQRRYDSLSKAYAYIGATFDKQMEYVNDYSEMNSLTQGLIETIVFDDIHNVGGKINIEKTDRLFALEHFCLNMGEYLDQLGQKMKDSELTILPNGRLVMPRGLIDKQNSYFYKLRDLTMNHPELYEKMSAFNDQPTLDIKDKAFLTAFNAEYDISFDVYQKIIKASIDYAIDNKQPVMNMPRNEFFDKVVNGILGSEDIALFESHFVLQKALKDEFTNYSDRWLQRFNRPVQLTARPWVLYDGKIYYTTKTLYESVMIKMERLSNGTINFSSQEMKFFVGMINDNKGHNFTKSLRKYYEELCDGELYVDSEAKIFPGKRLDSPIDLGDIDVLLIHKGRKQIVCIEVKNFVESRTVYELMLQNQKIVTKELSHVIKRDKWCKENKNKFKLYNANVDDDYTVKTIFLTYHENAYNYFEHDKNAIAFLSAIDIVRDPMVVFE